MDLSTVGELLPAIPPTMQANNSEDQQFFETLWTPTSANKVRHRTVTGADWVSDSSQLPKSQEDFSLENLTGDLDS